MLYVSYMCTHCTHVTKPYIELYIYPKCFIHQPVMHITLHIIDHCYIAA